MSLAPRTRAGFGCMAAMIVTTLLMTGCGGQGKTDAADGADGGPVTGGNGSTIGAPPISISGSVGDGPVVDARVVATDRSGREVAQTLSDNSAKYRLDLPSTTEFPVTIAATGGTDLVTGNAPTFQLLSVLADGKLPHAHATPLGTLITETARCRSGGVTTPNLNAARTSVLNEISGGLDSSVILDPLHDALNDDAIPEVVKANQIVAEIITRTTSTLIARGRTIEPNAVIASLGCDLADGKLDAAGPPTTDGEVTGVAKAAMVNVYAEALANQLVVEGAPANARLNDAIARISPNSTSNATVESVMVTPHFAREIHRALVAVSDLAPDHRLIDLSDALLQLQDPATPDALSAPIRDNSGVGSDVLERARAAEKSMLDDIADTNRRTQDVAPTVSVTSDRTVVGRGERATIQWTSTNAESCIATSGLTGRLDLNGSMTSEPLAAPLRVGIVCMNAAGNTHATLTVDVTTPYVELQANREFATAGDHVTLTWSSGHVSNCVASGAWSGAKPTSGSADVGAIAADATYSLTCNDGTSSAEATTTVRFQAQITPPDLTFNANPTTTNLAGSTTLSWSSTNADECAASGAWSGAKATRGTQSVSGIEARSTFTLTCRGAGGSVRKDVTIGIEPPTITNFGTADAVLSPGQSTQLSWTTRNASNCSASGAWNGIQPANGSFTTPAINRNSTFTLTCTGPGGTTGARSVQVRLRPTVTLRAASESVPLNAPATLTWTSSGATACVATSSDTHFTGSMPVSGSVTTNPLTTSTTFSIRCTNNVGEAVASVSVVVAATRVRWVAPTTMTDGSAITTLKGFNIRYGTQSRRYNQVESVLDPTATSESLTLGPGTWYIAVTALAEVTNLTTGVVEVRESAYSQEARKTVP